ncbi:hypothetical protein ILUMI_26190, partial [Ignelater luminosus]
MSSYYPVTDSTGCYYNFQHYDEGDRILTNEPCLNCTCHNRMLMCYLRVCPFTKAIGQDCTVEKRADQCCPVITCPEVPVPVQLLPSTTPSTALGHMNEYGCFIDNLFYSDGARVPSNPNQPCELCYCIRNRTACVMQECTLKIEGCKPVYQDGVCCPARYDCDHPEENLLETTTTERPGLIFTTTMLPGTSECVYNNEVYADGALIKKDLPCEHCYCMKGDIVCAVQECSPTPLDKVNCTAILKEDQCCPDTYDCDNIIEQELTTLSYYDYTTVSPRPVQPVESENEEENAILPTLYPSYTGKPFEVEHIPPSVTETQQPVTLEEETRAPGVTEQQTERYPLPEETSTPGAVEIEQKPEQVPVEEGEHELYPSATAQPHEILTELHPSITEQPDVIITEGPGGGVTEEHPSVTEHPGEVVTHRPEEIEHTPEAVTEHRPLEEQYPEVHPTLTEEPEVIATPSPEEIEPTPEAVTEHIPLEEQHPEKLPSVTEYPGEVPT